MNDSIKPAPPDRLVRIAIIVALVGLLCVLFFLIRGFDAISVGLGIFLGMPLVLGGIVLYLIAVFRDLRQRGAL